MRLPKSSKEITDVLDKLCGNVVDHSWTLRCIKGKFSLTVEWGNSPAILSKGNTSSDTRSKHIALPYASRSTPPCLDADVPISLNCSLIIFCLSILVLSHILFISNPTFTPFQLLHTQLSLFLTVT